MSRPPLSRFGRQFISLFARERASLAWLGLLALLLTIWLATTAADAARQPAALLQTSAQETPSGQSPVDTPTPTPSVPSLPETSSPTATPSATIEATATEESETVLTAMPTPASSLTSTAEAEEASATPVPTETPIPTGTPTPTVTVASPAALINLPPAGRTIELPTPTPSPDPLLFLARLANSAASAGGWIWFACGLLLFFVVAGIVAGLSFYSSGRRRYELYEVYAATDEEETEQFQALPDQASTDRSEEETWPASLP